jgi:hypothetical protein
MCIGDLKLSNDPAHKLHALTYLPHETFSHL